MSPIITLWSKLFLKPSIFKRVMALNSSLEYECINEIEKRKTNPTKSKIKMSICCFIVLIVLFFVSLLGFQNLLGLVMLFQT